MLFRTPGLLALLFLFGLALPAQAQQAAFSPMATPAAEPHAVTLRAAGAVGGMVAVTYGTFLLFYGSEADVDAPATAILLLPIAGAAGGSYVVGRLMQTPGSFSGAVVGTVLGMVPGIVVLAAAGTSTDAEMAGSLLLVGGAAVGAAVGYGSPRLSLGFIRVPGGTAPSLRLRF
ncbi:MAG TPA: hypothetical protein VD948_03570 [Rhodothermales bacterium]|nr:hypothetical protein [Rhodothermales bacterium]